MTLGINPFSTAGSLLRESRANIDGAVEQIGKIKVNALAIRNILSGYVDTVNKQDRKENNPTPPGYRTKIRKELALYINRSCEQMDSGRLYDTFEQLDALSKQFNAIKTSAEERRILERLIVINEGVIVYMDKTLLSLKPLISAFKGIDISF